MGSLCNPSLKQQFNEAFLVGDEGVNLRRLPVQEVGYGQLIRQRGQPGLVVQDTLFRYASEATSTRHAGDCVGSEIVTQKQIEEVAPFGGGAGSNCENLGRPKTEAALKACYQCDLSILKAGRNFRKDNVTVFEVGVSG
ncbi:MAG: hypothetical protein FWD59_01970 [Micrococcales bacterium]|nr:hypothetical protein [Micrococcales bacterium]